MNYASNLPHLTHLQSGFSLHAKNPFADKLLPEINCQGYRLRKICTADLGAWYNYLCLPEVAKHMSWEVKSPYDLQQFTQEQDWSNTQAQLKLAITNSDDKLVGTIGFHTISTSNLSAEIAYDLSPQSWGNGIISAACQSLTLWAHQEIGLVRVQACVLDTNERSLKVLKNCHFQQEGLLRKYKQVRGQSRDYWMLSHIYSESMSPNREPQ